MGALTAAAVLRFEMLAALAGFAPHLVSDFHVRSQPLADRTTAALVVFLVAAAASAHPLLADRAGID